VYGNAKNACFFAFFLAEMLADSDFCRTFASAIGKQAWLTTKTRQAVFEILP
jgi:hypothetical protein